MRTDLFDYELPASLIAQHAIEPRHDARLLVASNLSEVPFHRLATILEPGDLLVVNRTKVRAARLIGRRVPTGGKAEILLTKRVDPRYSDEGRWEALLRPAKKLGVGAVIECGAITAEVLSDPVEGVATVTLTTGGDIEEAIADAGELPLPPYFHGSLDSPERYQTMFAKTVGSSAAPTASLHFTQQVVDDLVARGVEFAEVELLIGLDTFRPMTDGRVEDHRIHSERVIVGRDVVDAVERVRETGGRVVAVGTTVVRSLESAATSDGRIGTFEDETDLFIKPGYRFGVVDALITNFHAPRTSLIVMIAAVLNDRWRTVYDHALKEGFRFLSFGDAMFIEVVR